MHVCNRCGKENQEHYKFCLGCGAEIGDAPAAVPRPVPAPSVSSFDRSIDEGWKSQPAPSDPGLSSLSEDDGFGATAIAPKTQTHDTDPGRIELHGASPTSAPAAPMFSSAPPPQAAPVAGRSCPACGNFVPTGFVFCGQCGTRVAEVAKPVEAAPRVAISMRGKLVLIRPDGTEGGAHPLSDGANLIGRGQGLLFDSDSYLSPHHADLVLAQGGLLVRDAGSLNGAFAKITDEEEIADGEVFRIGQELLRFDVIRAPATLEDGTEVMGSPNPGYWGRVALIIGRALDGSAFPLVGETTVLGRERGDILFPEDGYVSGTHARLSNRGGRFFLADLNSSNGTFLRIRGERTVRSGTFLLMGQQLFRVQYS